MRHLFYILTLVGAFSFLSCSANQPLSNSEKELPSGDIYVNEHGQITLNKLNDSIMQVRFENNKGNTFDTVMEIASKENYKLAYGYYPFLKWHWGGIQMHEYTLQVIEFSSMAYINQYIQIENIYTRPFYKIGDTIQLSGLIERSKGDLLLNSMYLSDKNFSQGDFIQSSGIVKKEKYPRAYYSTPESPQGMFGDTNVVHYRLIFEPITSKKIEKQVFTGTLMNNENDAAFIYDFADSEIFYVDSIQSWNESEINKHVTIEGYLVQFENGRSVIKSWNIIARD